MPRTSQNPRPRSPRSPRPPHALILLASLAATWFACNALAAEPVGPSAPPPPAEAPAIVTTATTAELRGTVTTDGQPVAGATVHINRAWPRKGPAFYCPGCYIDCTKSTKTDADGKWTIPGLDPDLVFELVVVREGCISVVTDRIDPAAAEQPVIRIKKRDLSKVLPNQSVRGIVVDSDGTPIEGASVEPRMVWATDFQSGHGGNVEGLDPFAITNAKGEFELFYNDNCGGMDLRVEVVGKAAKCFERLASAKTHTLKLTDGGSVTGRLLFNGKPVPSVRVGLCGEGPDRSGTCFERMEIGTLPNGVFEFTNVPAGKRYQVYPVFEDTLVFGSAEPVLLQIKSDGQSITLPDIELKPGFAFEGRVVTFDGEPVPPLSRITIESRTGWNNTNIMLPPDGRFHFANLPKGQYSINISAKGYRASADNPNIDTLNGGLGQLLGTVSADVRDFIILLGSVDEPIPAREDADPSRKPLRGIERPTR